MGEGLGERPQRKEIALLEDKSLLLILKILHDPSILGYHYSQGIRYLGSCRIFSIHRCFDPSSPPTTSTKFIGVQRGPHSYKPMHAVANKNPQPLAPYYSPVLCDPVSPRA